MNWLFLLCFIPSLVFAAPPQETSDLKRAKQLQDFIQKEKPRFEARETQRKGLTEDLDKLNLNQNRVRQKLDSISGNYTELKMALENMAVEIKNQEQQEVAQKQRLLLLMKIVYKIRKEGIVRFLMNGENLSSIAGRFRVLFHTLKAHGAITRQLEDRANRLAESEKRLGSATSEVKTLVAELKEQEGLLQSLLEKKHKLLGALSQKQHAYQGAMKEYRAVSKQLANLFDNFESVREGERVFPNRGTLPLPVELGRIVKNFGRSVHEKFQTVTYQKGIEIEADHNTPVTAVLPGVVEYDGWVKGLGNVVILHHGGGFYSLSAHLFKSVKTQGTQVKQGDVIGLVGDTGNNDKPSLYFELRENGKAVDPVMYFSAASLASLQ